MGGPEASRGPHNIREFDPIPRDLEMAWAAFKVNKFVSQLRANE